MLNYNLYYTFNFEYAFQVEEMIVSIDEYLGFQPIVLVANFEQA